MTSSLQTTMYCPKLRVRPSTAKENVTQLQHKQRPRKQTSASGGLSMDCYLRSRPREMDTLRACASSSRMLAVSHASTQVERMHCTLNYLMCLGSPHREQSILSLVCTMPNVFCSLLDQARHVYQPTCLQQCHLHDTRRNRHVLRDPGLMIRDILLLTRAETPLYRIARRNMSLTGFVVSPSPKQTMLRILLATMAAEKSMAGSILHMSHRTSMTKRVVISITSPSMYLLLSHIKRTRQMDLSLHKSGMHVYNKMDMVAHSRFPRNTKTGSVVVSQSTIVPMEES